MNEEALSHGTITEALDATRELIDSIQLPVGLMEEIGFKLLAASKNLRMINDSLKQSIAQAEQPPELHVVEVANDQEE